MPVPVKHAAPISNSAWSAYVLASEAEKLNALALVHGEEHPLVIEAREAWRHGDVYRMGELIEQIKKGGSSSI